MRTDVAVLFVDPLGPYPGLCAECYDLDRDATSYAGSLPVVAHPPCGPWGKLRTFCTKQDASLAPWAVEAVQRWGGVLEHPVGSQIWKACRLPRVGELPVEAPGFTMLVEQWWWGHRAVKQTLLYVVGLQGSVPEIPKPPGPRPVAGKEGFANLSKGVRRRTPPAFAEWLLELASRCRV